MPQLGVLFDTSISPQTGLKEKMTKRFLLWIRRSSVKVHTIWLALIWRVPALFMLSIYVHLYVSQLRFNCCCVRMNTVPRGLWNINCSNNTLCWKRAITFPVSELEIKHSAEYKTQCEGIHAEFLEYSMSVVKKNPPVDGWKSRYVQNPSKLS